MGALSRWRSETTRVVPSLLESWASWLLVPSAASMLDPLALDVAISCVKETRGRVRHQPRRRAQNGRSAAFTYYSGIILNSRQHLLFSKLFRNNRRAERAPHLSYSGEKSSSYIYICFLYIYIYIYTFVRRARARYAQTSDRPVEVQRSI